MTDDQFLVEAYFGILEARAASELRESMEVQRLRQEDAISAPATKAKPKRRSKSAITHRAYLLKIRVLAASRSRASQPVQLASAL